MPIYEYRCLNGHHFEVMRRFSDPPIEACDECGEEVQKVLTAPAIHFKGSGFHATDYGRGKSGRPSDSGDGAKSGGESGTTDSGSSGESASTAAPAPSTKSTES